MIHRSSFKNVLLISFSAFIIALFTGCGTTQQLQSGWRESEIKIDGDITDWQGGLIPAPEKKITIGFRNDEKYLYICLVTDDRAKIMQMFRAGFITWFQPDNDNSKTFGIKFPLSSKFAPREQVQNMNREMFQPGNLENLVKNFLERQNEFEVVNKSKYPLTLLPLENREGIRAKLGFSSDRLIYELQVPFAVSDEYSFQIASLPGENLIIKFETEEMEFDGARGGMTGMSPQGGGQRGGGGMRPQGAGRISPPEPLNYSVEIKLHLPVK